MRSLRASRLAVLTAAYPWPEADEYFDHIAPVGLALADENLVILMSLQIVTENAKVRDGREI